MGRYNLQTGAQLPPEQRRVPRRPAYSAQQPAPDVPEIVQQTDENDIANAVITPAKRVKKKSPDDIQHELHSDALFFTRKILGEAINQGASDVHFEPKENELEIRFRVDGALRFYEQRTLEEYTQILNSVKVLGDMDIAEHSVPQDGHIELAHELSNQDISKGSKPHIYDIRVSLFPSVNGEVIVMRILNRNDALLTIEELGMDPNSLEKLNEVLLNSYGMILITGPTGSGKTTTLYSVMSELRNEEKNIITLEDPIEFHLDWLRQCEIREKRGFTFEKAMESVLRQDPDVLMVGEIRDGQTAEHAVRSALVGRIVGSTIHANTTIGTIARLIELGISRSIVGHTLNVIIAQRLVRSLCDSCKEIYTPDERLLRHFGLETTQAPFFRGKGCNACNNVGFKGRTGIFSIMTFDEMARNLLFDQRPLVEINNYAVEKGMKTLKEDAAEKILAGLITVEEASRVI